ncbi:MAG: Crp/Fnr family transcriptional regulator [Flavobacteriales bacterium]|nr:Crp/Fnr family transcriptional regulator [Flavobacteriales bacterium]
MKLKALKFGEIPECQNCAVQKSSLFCHLDREEIAQISDEKGFSIYKKGQSVFLQGNQPHGIFCIQEGKVKIHNIGEDGKEQILRFYGPGSVIGYRAVLSGENYFSNATVIEESRICFISKTLFLKNLKENASFAMFILNLLAHDLKVAESTIVSMAHKQVRERLAESLLRLRDFYGLESDNATINATLSRGELGSLAGTSAESTIRIIHELQEMNIIRLNGKKIVIIDAKKLDRIANPFHRYLNFGG